MSLAAELLQHPDAVRTIHRLPKNFLIKHHYCVSGKRNALRMVRSDLLSFFQCYSCHERLWRFVATHRFVGVRGLHQKIQAEASEQFPPPWRRGRKAEGTVLLEHSENLQGRKAVCSRVRYASEVGGIAPLGVVRVFCRGVAMVSM